MTWTPKTEQAETWTSQDNVITRGFDPAGFDNNPRFDTGTLSGVWADRTKQTETWAAA